jgi:negative regulator of sigma E activity
MHSVVPLQRASFGFALIQPCAMQAQKGAMAAAAVAVVVLGIKAVQKKREDDSAEGQAKNTAQKVSGSVRKAISAI